MGPISGARWRLGPGCRRPRAGRGGEGPPVTKWRREAAGPAHCARSRPRGGDWEGAPPSAAAVPGLRLWAQRLAVAPAATPFLLSSHLSMGS